MPVTIPDELMTAITDAQEALDVSIEEAKQAKAAKEAAEAADANAIVELKQANDASIVAQELARVAIAKMAEHFGLTTEPVVEPEA